MFVTLESSSQSRNEIYFMWKHRPYLWAVPLPIIFPIKIFSSLFLFVTSPGICGEEKVLSLKYFHCRGDGQNVDDRNQIHSVETELSHARAEKSLHSHSSGHLLHLWEQRALTPQMIIEVWNKRRKSDFRANEYSRVLLCWTHNSLAVVRVMIEKSTKANSFRLCGFLATYWVRDVFSHNVARLIVVSICFKIPTKRRKAKDRDACRPKNAQPTHARQAQAHCSVFTKIKSPITLTNDFMFWLWH